MDKQTIIDKIKKLIALRDGAQATGSEGEPMPPRAIQRLLTQYNPGNGRSVPVSSYQ